MNIISLSLYTSKLPTVSLRQRPRQRGGTQAAAGNRLTMT